MKSSPFIEIKKNYLMSLIQHQLLLNVNHNNNNYRFNNNLGIIMLMYLIVFAKELLIIMEIVFNNNKANMHSPRK